VIAYIVRWISTDANTVTRAFVRVIIAGGNAFTKLNFNQ